MRKRTVRPMTHPPQRHDTIRFNSTLASCALRSPEDFLSVWTNSELTVSRQVAISMLGAIGLALGAVACLSRLFDEAPGVSPWRRGFVARSGPIRPCEGRLTGGFEHALYRSAPNLQRLPPEAIAWGRSLGESAEARRSAQVISDTGLLRLFDGRLDVAVVSLEQAAARAPEDGAILSDLAAALIARGTSERRPRDFMLALAAADRAVRAAPDLLEARYNLALALEKALLIGQARSAWAEYRSRERNVKWADEALAHLNALDRDTEATVWQRDLRKLENLTEHHDSAGLRALVQRSPQSARLYLEETLLPRWAEARAGQRLTESASILGMARSLGEALAATNGDRMASDSVAVIDRALATGAAPVVTLLVDGHRAYARGSGLLRSQHHSEALAELTRAVDSLKAGGSPFWLWARVRAGSCEFYLGNPDLIEHLGKLGQAIDSARYPNLAARLSSLRGMVHGRLANMAEALRLYKEALSHFESTGEVENTAAVSFMLAENLRFQGETDLAWQYRHRALQMARDFGSSIYIHNALFDSAEAALQENYPHVALRYYDEMLQAALRDKDALGMAEALLRRSRAHQEAGNEQAALRDLSHAALWLVAIQSGDRRERLQADVARSNGEIALAARPREAVQTLTKAIAYAESRQERFRLPHLYWTRARAFLALQDLAQAREDLERGLAELEAQRSTIFDRQLQASYFDQAQAVFDEMIHLQQVRNQGALEAFETAERYRDQIAGGAVLDGQARGPLSLPALQEQLPAGIALLEYEVLPDRILAWVVTRDRFEPISIPLDRAGLRKRVRKLQTLLRDAPDSHRVQPALADLYAILIGSLDSFVGKAETLIISPDKELQSIPFSALFDSATQRYLIQDHAVGYTFSAKLLVAGRRRKPGSRTSDDALVVAATDFDRALFPGLSSIPEAEGEAKEIAALYDQKLLISGSAATKERFLLEAPRYEIIHFAGHARSNPERPLLSALIFAPGESQSSPGEAEVLSAKEIYGLRLTRTRLVVLAGCETASGDFSSSEGLSNLARPFLAAGVPTVVGSLWKVQDTAAKELFVEFYRHLQMGLGPLEALREAQTRLVVGSEASLRSPARWAAFEVIGEVESSRSKN